MCIRDRSIDVDNVSGATFTSNAIKNAVKNALTEAGVDVGTLAAAPEKAKDQQIADEASVVVVGGGGAGLAAAVSALQSGAERVIIVEKTDILGGDTNVNGGIYNTPDEQMQAKTAMTDGAKTLVEAARDLGANPVRAFFTITLPMTMPGILAGCVLVFVPSVGLFYLSDIMGGGLVLVGNLIRDQLLKVRDWNVGSAMSLVLMIIVLLCMSFTSSFDEDEMEGVS